MSAKTQYQYQYSQMRRSPRSRINARYNGTSNDINYQAYTSYMEQHTKDEDRMTFKQFIDCLEAADNGLAWATRQDWFFIVDGEELQFTNFEMGHFARYFRTRTMTLYEFRRILKCGGDSISYMQLEDDTVYHVYNTARGGEYLLGYYKSNAQPPKWIVSHNAAAEKATACQRNNDAIIRQFGAWNPRVGRTFRNGEVWLEAKTTGLAHGK